MIEDRIIVIPSYEPESLFIELIQEIKQNFAHIVVVNDGSDDSYKNIFNEIQKIPGVILLEHRQNQGKGAALKTAFRYVLKNFSNSVSVVMCDADGQHLPEDVLSVAQASAENPESFIFGVRNFSRRTTPFRSWFGNVLTKMILKLFLKTPLNDTQTGLRAYPTKYLTYFIDVPYDRYEYDTESILLISQNSWDIKSVPIKTVYIDGNRSSHFNPVVDSLKIYWVILRFSIVSFLSFLIDISIFAVMTIFSFPTFTALLTSKIISAIFNFAGHRFLTFQTKNNIIKSLSLYIFLWVFNLFVGVYLIDTMVMITAYDKLSIKICVDIFLFIVNFLISKLFIFKKPRK